MQRLCGPTRYRPLDKMGTDRYVAILQFSVSLMIPNGALLAWVEPYDSNHFMGAFVGKDAVRASCGHRPGRAPATRVFSSLSEAREWVDEQGAAFGVPVKWVRDPPPH
jgi:hypothetical protein